MFHDLLRERFGVTPRAVHAVRGGFSAKAYRVEAGDRTFFLKVYDKALPTVQPFIGRIDAYMPALGWLSAAQALAGRVAEPIPALDGACKAETAGHVFLLFAYVQGETPGEKGLTLGQTKELAQILASLHEAGTRIPFETPGLAEELSLSFCDKLARYLLDADAEETELSRLVCPHAATLRAAIEEAVRLRDTVRLNAEPLVLCHADAHSYNVMQGPRLVLVDWEDLRWAPAEADLFMQMHMQNPHWAAFLRAYAAARGGFRIHADLLRFYCIRRRLEDISADVERMTQEDPGQAEIARMFGWFRIAIADLHRLLSDTWEGGAWR